mmetsp:Transcript_33553/g.51595  ORF Transcript_33553/g.51595 Transcript_33553/m.51595 type:complete len:131 (-) Transcript_33553:202-594(-)
MKKPFRPHGRARDQAQIEPANSSAANSSNADPIRNRHENSLERAAGRNGSQGREREFPGRANGQPDGNPASDVEAAGPESDNQVPVDQFITMKKSKKFIKFKDYIIKLPNSVGINNPYRALLQKTPTLGN